MPENPLPVLASTAPAIWLALILVWRVTGARPVRLMQYQAENRGIDNDIPYSLPGSAETQIGQLTDREIVTFGYTV